MMQFHMKEAMSKGLRASVNEQLDVDHLFAGRADVIRASSLKAALEVAGYEEFVQVEGELSIDLELACSRCLDPTIEHTVIPFLEQFKPTSNDAGLREEDEEESDYIEVTADRLDLTPYVEEALLLFMPFAPLCKDECKGLCHNCGQNLNERKCDCQTDRIDPRFEALKDLFKQ